MRESRYNVWVDVDDTTHVFNGLSGQLVNLTSSQVLAFRSLVESGDLAGLDEAFARRLVEARVLVRDELDEIALLNGRWLRNTRDPRRLGLTLVTSLGCNFDCPYCFEDKRPSIMSPEVQRNVLGLVTDSVGNLESLDVTWMGGEPLVGRRVIYDLSDRFIEVCDANGIAFSSGIVTNGWYLTPDVCDELLARRMSWAQVTIDGPPDVHDRNRPLVGGGKTFDRVLANLHHAVERFDVSVRVNVDNANLGRVEELFQILEAEGLGGRLHIGAAKTVSWDDNPSAPMASYQSACFTSPEFARVELEFNRLAARYGLGTPTLPSAIGSPCTAVQANSLTVGSEGELYKCWDSIGNLEASIGHIANYKQPNERVLRWLLHNPTEDAQCSQCVALPVCMGGCAHYGFVGNRSDDKCGTFRYTYREQVEEYVRHGNGEGPYGGALPLIDAARTASGFAIERSVGPVPVSLGATRSRGPATPALVAAGAP
jgi:uncharacterized protein